MSAKKFNHTPCTNSTNNKEMGGAGTRQNANVNGWEKFGLRHQTKRKKKKWRMLFFELPHLKTKNDWSWSQIMIHICSAWWKPRTSSHGYVWTTTHTHLTAARRACAISVSTALFFQPIKLKSREQNRLDKSPSTRGIEKTPARFHHPRCLAVGRNS